MAIKDAYLKFGSRRGPVRRSGGGYSYYETWIVLTDSTSDDGLVVEQANRLPRYGQAYPEDASAMVVEIDPQQSDESELVWEVFLTYSTSSGGGSPATPGQATAMIPRRWWRSRYYRTYKIFKDLDGKAFVNTVGDAYDPPPPMYKVHRILAIELDRIGWDEQVASDYQNHINSNPITVDQKTYPPKSGLLTTFHGTQKFAGDGQPYWTALIEIEFKPDLWDPFQEVNRGPRCRKRDWGGGGGTLNAPVVLVHDDNGVLTGRIELLDENGFLLKKGDEPFLIDWRIYEAKDFTPLNLPLQ